MMTNVLVAYASKHGSTREIAEAIAEELRTAGVSADIRDVATVESLDGLDAVVLGSAIYIGQWRTEAVSFVDRHSDSLAAMPVWLFSSGPLGTELFPAEDPPATSELFERTGARDYRNFAGKLDRSQLGLGERLVTRVVRAPEGDFRQWQEIRDWAKAIAVALTDTPKTDRDSERYDEASDQKITDAPASEETAHSQA